ncbi:MAG: RES domain-containing protein [Cyanobacteria bacterium REEB67]|nr:RES domain-containing protein [Cyanobacteria bacterium REEB67]
MTMVAIDLPPPKIRPKPIWTKVAKGRQLVRMYHPNRFGATELSFRDYGPISRFDHHRIPINRDVERGIMYAGTTLSCCIVEIFGDSKIVQVDGWMVALITTKRDLTLLELRGKGAMRAGTVASISKDSNREFSQAWSRYFYENPFLYEAIDGLVFSNAHNEEESFALYETCSDALECTQGQFIELSDSTLRTEVLLAASENNLKVAPYQATT